MSYEYDFHYDAKAGVARIEKRGADDRKAVRVYAHSVVDATGDFSVDDLDPGEYTLVLISNNVVLDRPAGIVESSEGGPDAPKLRTIGRVQCQSITIAAGRTCNASHVFREF